MTLTLRRIGWIGDDYSIVDERSAAQIALFVAPVLVLLSYVVGPTPMDLQFWPGAVKMVIIAAVIATFVTNSGRSAWFVGALLIFIYAVLALTLYVVPPAGQVTG